MHKIIEFLKHQYACETPHWAQTIIKNQEAIMAAIDDLATAVAAEDTVIDGAVTLLQGIPAMIAAAGTDPAKLLALQNDIKSHTAVLAAAVLANTPAPPPGPPVVTPDAASAAATIAAKP